MLNVKTTVGFFVFVVTNIGHLIAFGRPMDRITAHDVAMRNAHQPLDATNLVAGGVDALLLRGGAGGNQGEGREQGEMFHNSGSVWDVRPRQSVESLRWDVKWWKE